MYCQQCAAVDVALPTMSGPTNIMRQGTSTDTSVVCCVVDLDSLPLHAHEYVSDESTRYLTTHNQLLKRIATADIILLTRTTSTAVFFHFLQFVSYGAETFILKLRTW